MTNRASTLCNLSNRSNAAEFWACSHQLLHIASYAHAPSCSLTHKHQSLAATRALSGCADINAQVVSEISYVMIKPDGVQRGLVSEVIGRFERKGFKLVGLKLYQVSICLRTPSVHLSPCPLV
jgi:predicted nucleic acid-binding protein